MFEIIKQEWFPNTVKVTHLLPKLATNEEARETLKKLPHRKNITYEIRKVENVV